MLVVQWLFGGGPLGFWFCVLRAWVGALGGVVMSVPSLPLSFAFIPFFVGLPCPWVSCGLFPCFFSVVFGFSSLACLAWLWSPAGLSLPISLCVSGVCCGCRQCWHCVPSADYARGR